MNNKFITDIRYAEYVAVLMYNGNKEFISKWKWNSPGGFDNPNIERELNSTEYVDFIQDKGFIVGCEISYWTNPKPLKVAKITEGSGGYVQPSLWIDRGGIYPAKLYDCTLIVKNPEQFWHYNYKK